MIEHNSPEQRDKKDKPDWLKKLDEMKLCEHCGVIVGACLMKAIGKECERNKLVTNK